MPNETLVPEQLSHVSSAGLLRVQIVEQDSSKLLVPVELRAYDGQTGFTITPQDVQITFATTDGAVVLTPDGFYLESPFARKLPYNQTNLQRLARAIATDAVLQQSFLVLQRAVPEAIAALQHDLDAQGRTYILPEPIVRVVQRQNESRAETMHRYPSILAAYSAQGSGTLALSTIPIMHCTLKKVVEIHTETIKHYTEKVIKALHQYQQCVRRCSRKFKTGSLNWWKCQGNCVAEGFVDAVITVLDYVETVTVETVTWIEVCEPVSVISSQLEEVMDIMGTMIPTPHSLLVDKAVEILKPLKGALVCLLDGEWGIDQTGDLPLPADWDWPDLLGSVPIAVRICVGHACAMTIKNCMVETAKNVGSLGVSALAACMSPSVLAEAVIAILGASVVDATTAAIAAATGLGASEILPVVAGIAISMAIEAGIIAGQISLFEKGNGVCLHKSPIPIPVGTSIVLFPTVVTSR